MAKTNNNLEKFGLMALLGLIGFGFLSMVVALLRTPSTPPLRDVTEPERAAVERTRESLRTYSAPLTVHSYTFGVEPEEKNVDPDEHRHLMPDAPDPVRASAGNPMMALPAPPMLKPQDSDDEDREGANDPFGIGGWGWLANDVVSSRRDEPLAGRLGRESMDRTARGGMPETSRQDADDDSEDTDDPFTAARSDRPGALDRAGEWERDAATGPLLRPMEAGGGERDEARDRPNDRADDGTQRARDEREETSATDEQDEEAGQEATPSVLAMRDPFAPSEDRPAPFGAGSWSFGARDAVVTGSGVRDAETGDEREAETGGRLESIRGAFDEPADRLVGDAATDAARLSAGWSGYASDSVFLGGGGYTPQAVTAIGSEPLFSGSSTLGGSFNPARSEFSSGGITPIGGSGSLIEPSSGVSPLATPRESGVRANPSALPW